MADTDHHKMMNNTNQVKMTLPKIEAPQFETIEISSGTLTSIGSHAHYTTASTESTIGINSVISSDGAVIAASDSGITIGSDHDTDNYNNIQYVTPVVPLEEEQDKFSNSVVSVPVDNVAFVQMNDNTLKEANTVNGPLDIYFGVIPSTTGTSVVSTSSNSNHFKHEHLAPKAQILERVYSDIILEQKQQDLQNAVSMSLHEPSSILPHSLQESEDRVIVSHSSSGTELRKQKVNLQIRQNSHGQHRQILADQVSSNESQLESMNDTNVKDINRHLMISKNNVKMEMQDNNSDCIQLQPLSHDNISLSQNRKSSDINVKLVTNTVDSNKSQHCTQQTTTMPLMSRSGRLIRRRPEYVAYVNETNQQLPDEFIVAHTTQNNSFVKSEVDLNVDTSLQFESSFDDILDGEDHEGDQFSNEDDEELDSSTQYITSDGKKSLPHKKRIPRKLKNTKKNIKFYKCIECGEQFSTQQQLSQHKISIHSNNTNNVNVKNSNYICELCNKTLENQLKFYEHLKDHYEPSKKFKCYLCYNEYDSAEALQEHSLTHSHDNFECDICKKTFRKEIMLEMHIKSAHIETDIFQETTEKVFPCIVCQKTFIDEVELNNHIQSNHNQTTTEYSCEDCYRVFKSDAKLATHRKIEHKDEAPINKTSRKKSRGSRGPKSPFTCPMCPKTFIHKNSLVYHIRGHTGERPHVCPTCNKAFYAASALKVHLRLHSGEKPYKCVHCDKYFRQWGDLRYHTTSVHSDARQYQCEYCGKDFKRKYCLVVHTRIHTGEKNYKCDTCNKAFRAASYLQNHRRIHTGERPHPCPDCGKPFRVRSDMRRHRQIHQRENNNTNSSSITTTPISNSTNSNLGVGQITTTSSTPRQAVHQQGQIQYVQGQLTTSAQPQLIIADPVNATGDQPIRIMVSNLGGSQAVSNSVNPPPAHRRGQLNNVTVTTMTPSSPTNSTDVSTAIGPEVIMLDQSTHEPINLNMIPRMITQAQVTPVSSLGTQDSLVGSEDDYQITTSNNCNATLEMREDGNVLVWHGVFSS